MWCFFGFNGNLNDDWYFTIRREKMKQKTKFLILIICFTVFILLVLLGYKYLSTKYKDIFENQNVQAQNKAPDFTVYNKKRRGYKII